MMNESSHNETDVLHITTDTITAAHLDSAFTSGVFLAWQDALYEGPISAEASITHLSSQRAEYFASAGWVKKQDIEARYTARNKLLFAYQQFKEVVLWFDHDLNSQLQMVQLIEWFSRHKLDKTLLSLVSVGRLNTRGSYQNLNARTKQDIQALMSNRWEVTMGQMTLCQHAWHALGASNPNTLLRFYNTNSSTLPFLKNAVLRFLKQYPSQINGLSHSESLIANALLHQHNEPNDIYLTMQRKEGIAFMSRPIFANCLQNMCEGAMPLVAQQTIEIDMDDMEDSDNYDETVVEKSIEKMVERKTILKLSDLGRQVLHNWVDWIQVNGVNRWLGGVHLKEGSLWRYDETRRKVVKTYV